MDKTTLILQVKKKLLSRKDSYSNVDVLCKLHALLEYENDLPENLDAELVAERNQYKSFVFSSTTEALNMVFIAMCSTGCNVLIPQNLQKGFFHFFNEFKLLDLRQYDSTDDLVRLADNKTKFILANVANPLTYQSNDARKIIEIAKENSIRSVFYNDFTPLGFTTLGVGTDVEIYNMHGFVIVSSQNKQLIEVFSKIYKNNKTSVSCEVALAKLAFFEQIFKIKRENATKVAKFFKEVKICSDVFFAEDYGSFAVVACFNSTYSKNAVENMLHHTRILLTNEENEYNLQEEYSYINYTNSDDKSYLQIICGIEDGSSIIEDLKRALIRLVNAQKEYEN